MQGEGQGRVNGSMPKDQRNRHVPPAPEQHGFSREEHKEPEERGRSDIRGPFGFYHPIRSSQPTRLYREPTGHQYQVRDETFRDRPHRHQRQSSPITLPSLSETMALHESPLPVPAPTPMGPPRLSPDRPPQAPYDPRPSTQTTSEPFSQPARQRYVSPPHPEQQTRPRLPARAGSIDPRILSPSSPLRRPLTTRFSGFDPSRRSSPSRHSLSPVKPSIDSIVSPPRVLPGSSVAHVALSTASSPIRPAILSGGARGPRPEDRKRVSTVGGFFAGPPEPVRDRSPALPSRWPAGHARYPSLAPGRATPRVPSPTRRSAPSPAWFSLGHLPQDRSIHSWSPTQIEAYDLGFHDAIVALENGFIGVRGEQYHNPIHVRREVPGEMTVHPSLGPRATGEVHRRQQRIGVRVSPTTAAQVAGPVRLTYRRRRDARRAPYYEIDPTSPSPYESERAAVPGWPIRTPPQSRSFESYDPRRYIYTDQHVYHSHVAPSLNAPRGPGPGRGHRQQISCHPCRHRKVKCSGETPCEECRKKGLEAECRYADRVRRRGKGKKRSDEENSMESVEVTSVDRGEGSSGSGYLLGGVDVDKAVMEDDFEIEEDDMMSMEPTPEAEVKKEGE